MMDVNLLRMLCCESGVSGNEKMIRNKIISLIKNDIDDLKIDNLGNIIAFKKGRSNPQRRVMISAHMDEVGLITNYVTEEGFLKFSTVGGISSDVLLGKHVMIGENLVPGVIGSKPVHLIESDEKKESVPIDDMYIDIGALDNQNALNYVSIGDYISFEPIFNMNSNGTIYAKAVDDRVGCFILINMIKKELPFDIYFTFVVQEEVGLRGAKVAAYNVNPDIAIVVDATTASDIPGVDDERKVCKLNEGTVLSFMDRSTIYDREYFDLALSIAKQNSINSQVKQAIAGGNDSGAINISRSGVKTIALSLPCRYLHSPLSVVSINDIESTERLLYQLVDKLCF